MSIPQSSSTNNRNGTTSAALSQSNLNQVPRANRSTVDRYTRASAADGPYYAGARMQERSSHLTGLSNQVNAVDEILKK
ncbi:hypothetical protein N7509_013849 [Penicillium cosmopolitanum]|uniref:Uncharacterized protein n=1 Tax=Penicillium cosmopolitanum TaxID=1131564 RepID=A0A9W9SIM2_9EURO|nr:uncharacterized protein N7509_013849 [Penicillium cosmopolitanum]KAJ5376963.1 hypothetical protein N7509_013849 [Penicillium cosmopolitanum]